MTRKIDPRSARQGGRGVKVFVVLVVALILATIAWLGAEWYGESIDTPTDDPVEGGNPS